MTVKLITITQFTVSFSRTINLGNFESARVEASVTTSMPEEQGSADLEVAKHGAQVELRRILEETYKHQYTDRKKIA